MIEDDHTAATLISSAFGVGPMAIQPRRAGLERSARWLWREAISSERAPGAFSSLTLIPSEQTAMAPHNASHAA